MVRNKWVLGLLGAGLLVVGMAGGVVLASNFNANAGNYAGIGRLANTPATSNNAYCQLYMSTVAGKLGTTSDKLTSANQAGIQTVLDQMVKDGKLTAAQETKIEQRLQNAGKNPCALIGRFIGRGGPRGGALRGMPGGPLGAALKGARGSLESAVASALKLQSSALDTDLASGKTIAQLATTQKVDLSTVKTAYLNEAKTLLGQAVTNKTITQDQSNAIYTKLQSAVNNGHFPLLEGRHMMPPVGQGAVPSN